MKHLGLFQKVAAALLLASIALSESHAASSLNLGTIAGAGFVTADGRSLSATGASVSIPSFNLNSFPSLNLNSSLGTQASSGSTTGASVALPSLNLGTTVFTTAAGNGSGTTNTQQNTGSSVTGGLLPVTVETSTQGSNSLTSVPATFTSTVAPKSTYTLKANSGGNGTISPSGPYKVAAGSSKTFTITPASGCAVSEVTVDGFSIGKVSSYTFTNVSADHTISATFERLPTYTINASVVGLGSISPSGTVSLIKGTTKTYSITPASGSIISRVIVDGVQVEAVSSYTFRDLDSDHTISATFERLSTYTLNASSGPNGMISPSGIVSLMKGSSKTYSITPASGYVISQVVVDGVQVGAVSRYTFSDLDSNHTISATFERLSTYTIKASFVGLGSISPSGTVSLIKGTTKTYSITPASGSVISQVVVDGVQVGAVSSYTFPNLSTNHTISATFERLPTYTIKASSVGIGTISPSGIVSLIKGTSKTYSITPASGYLISQVTVDGVRMGAVPSYTFPNLSANHTIEATFVAKAAKAAKAAAAPTPASVYASGEYFSVNSLSGWQNTGVDVAKGQDLEVSVYGHGIGGAGGALLGTIVPPGGSAIHSPVFLVGDDYQAPVKTAGRLWLRLNAADSTSKSSAGGVLVNVQHAPNGE